MKFGCQACGGLGHAPQNLTLRCEPCGGTGSRERCFACDKLVAFGTLVRQTCRACIAALRAPEDKRDAIADGAFA